MRSYHVEHQVEDGNLTFAVNRQEGETIEALQVALCKTPRYLISSATGLQKGAYT